jgi:hypothetical protein
MSCISNAPLPMSRYLLSGEISHSEWCSKVIARWPRPCEMLSGSDCSFGSSDQEQYSRDNQDQAYDGHGSPEPKTGYR